MQTILNFHYINHKKITRKVRLYPKTVRYGSSHWYEGKHWFLCGYDIDRKTEREYKLTDMIATEEVDE